MERSLYLVRCVHADGAETNRVFSGHREAYRYAGDFVQKNDGKVEITKIGPGQDKHEVEATIR